MIPRKTLARNCGRIGNRDVAVLARDVTFIRLPRLKLMATEVPVVCRTYEVATSTATRRGARVRVPYSSSFPAG
jgi:hypothetical protein